MVFLFGTINYLNFKREPVFLYWLKLTYEIKPRNGDYRKILNFTRNSEDEKFFYCSSQINYKLSQLISYLSYVGSVFLCLPYFRSEGGQLSFATFWFFACANCWIFCIFFLKFIQVICCLNLFPVVMLRHFSGRCRHILRQIEALKNAKRGINNAKLREITFDFNSLMLQIANVNGYWKFLFGKLHKSFLIKMDIFLILDHFQASTFFVCRQCQ